MPYTPEQLAIKKEGLRKRTLANQERRFGLETPLGNDTGTLRQQGIVAGRGVSTFNPASITGLIQEALNKRLSAQQGGLQDKISQAVLFAGRGADASRFPGAENLDPRSLLAIQESQQRGLLRNVESLFSLREGLEARDARELNTLKEALSEARQTYKERVEQVSRERERRRDLSFDLLKLQLSTPKGQTIPIPAELGGGNLPGLEVLRKKGGGAGRKMSETELIRSIRSEIVEASNDPRITKKDIEQEILARGFSLEDFTDLLESLTFSGDLPLAKAAKMRRGG